MTAYELYSAADRWTKELINIGGGHAATSLSKLLQQPIDMRVPEVEILAYEDLYQQIMAEDKEVHVVISQIEGAFRGSSCLS